MFTVAFQIGKHENIIYEVESWVLTTLSGELLIDSRSRFSWEQAQRSGSGHRLSESIWEAENTEIAVVLKGRPLFSQGLGFYFLSQSLIWLRLVSMLLPGVGRMVEFHLISEWWCRPSRLVLLLCTWRVHFTFLASSFHCSWLACCTNDTPGAIKAVYVEQGWRTGMNLGAQGCLSYEKTQEIYS